VFFVLDGAPTLSAVAQSSNNSPNYTEVSPITLWISENADCTNYFVAKDYGTPNPFNLFEPGNPALFRGLEESQKDKTYRCIIIMMSDIVRFSPVNSSGPCVTGSKYTFDMLTDGMTGYVDKDMNPVTVSGNPLNTHEDHLFIFGTTDVNAVIARGAIHHQVVALPKEIIPPSTMTLVVDFTDKVIEDSGKCWLEQTTFTIK